MAFLKDLEDKQKLVAQAATEEIAGSVGPWCECTHETNANIWKLKDPIYISCICYN